MVTSFESWRAHLATAGLPQIHFVTPAVCEPDALRCAGADLGFVTLHLDARRVGSTSDFMTEIATAARFPAYFGRNWDAVLDLLTDFSWAPANGYVLLITDGDRLLQMGSHDVRSFAKVIETTIRDWRDERGEYGERSGPVPFHLVLCGTEVLRKRLANVLTERFCEHPS